MQQIQLSDEVPAGMIICLEEAADDLCLFQLMLLPRCYLLLR